MSKSKKDHVVQWNKFDGTKHTEYSTAEEALNAENSAMMDAEVASVEVKRFES
jgi:hypothetical protein